MCSHLPPAAPSLAFPLLAKIHAKQFRAPILCFDFSNSESYNLTITHFYALFAPLNRQEIENNTYIVRSPCHFGF